MYDRLLYSLFSVTASVHLNALMTVVCSSASLSVPYLTIEYENERHSKPIIGRKESDDTGDAGPH